MDRKTGALNDAAAGSSRGPRANGRHALPAVLDPESSAAEHLVREFAALEGEAVAEWAARPLARKDVRTGSDCPALAFELRLSALERAGKRRARQRPQNPVRRWGALLGPTSPESAVLELPRGNGRRATAQRARSGDLDKSSLTIGPSAPGVSSRPSPALFAGRGPATPVTLRPRGAISFASPIEVASRPSRSGRGRLFLPTDQDR